MKLLLNLSAAAMLAGCAFGQRAGDVPPALKFEKLKGQCPEGLNWSDLLGKVVVVLVSDQGIFPETADEWSRLPEKLANEPVVFLRVVNGPEFLIDQTFKNAPHPGCILLDGKSENRESLGLPRFYPRSVVVDQWGLIAGYTRNEPSEESIRSILNHQKDTGLSATPPQPQEPASLIEPQELSYEVHISPTANRSVRRVGEAESDRYISMNLPLKPLIITLWNGREARTLFPEGLDEGSYDVTAYLPVSDPDLRRKLVNEALELQFGLSIDKETRLARVYVLKSSGKPSSQLRPANQDEKKVISGGGEVSMFGTDHPIKLVADGLEYVLKVPVIDETGLEGSYEYSASSKLPAPDSAFDMAHQLGLELVPGERSVEMLVVRKVR
jgi:uncharacterized protein (TIGR03435 family)